MKGPEYFPVYNKKELNYEVHCSSGCVIAELPSFDCARYIAQLACLGHIFLDGDKIRVSRETDNILICQENGEEPMELRASPPKSMVAL